MKTFTLEQMRLWEPNFEVDNLPVGPEEFITVLDVLDWDIPFDRKLWIVCRELLLNREIMLRFANACYAQAHRAYVSKGKDLHGAAAIGERNVLQNTTTKQSVRLQENFIDLMEPRITLKSLTCLEDIRRDNAQILLGVARMTCHTEPARRVALATAKFAGKAAAWACVDKGFKEMYPEIQKIQKQMLQMMIARETITAQEAVLSRLAQQP